MTEEAPYPRLLVVAETGVQEAKGTVEAYIVGASEGMA